MKKLKFGRIVILSIILLMLLGDLWLIDYSDLTFSNNIVSFLGVPTCIMLFYGVIKFFRKEEITQKRIEGNF
jgi:hypothetical protein